MTEKEFILLTQDACPGCERLKKMLAGPLKGQFDEQVEVVHRQSDPQGFEALASRYGVQSVPALIRVSDGERVRDAGSLGEVKGFLQGGQGT